MKKILFLTAIFSPLPLFSMHIMEGFLPVGWSLFWWIAMVPVFVLGIRKLKLSCTGNANAMLMLALAGAYTFILSALKLPSLTGSCSHPTGMALGALLFGPFSIAIVGVIVLLFQAILLAHGGLTTLGANSFSMAFAGPVVTWSVYMLVRKLGVRQPVAIVVSAALGSFATYCITAVQLGLAHPSADGGIVASSIKFLAVFAPTQLPISIIEGIVTLVAINAVSKYQMLETGVFRTELSK